MDASEFSIFPSVPRVVGKRGKILAAMGGIGIVLAIYHPPPITADSRMIDQPASEWKEKIRKVGLKIKIFPKKCR